MRKVVAIVGRPNVGKSTLFNRIIGRRVAIVHPESGVTRDRNYGEAEWTGKRFFLIDTGGFVPHSDEEFNRHIRDQVKIAIDEADIIIFVTDGDGGLHPIDVEIANNLRKHSKGKEIILATNKIDNVDREMNKNEFFSLGLGMPYDISALSGKNVAELLDEISKDMEENDEIEDKRIKFAIIGRPNSGKSSIVNALLNEERHIVTDIPGTTRDSIDSVVKFHGEEIVLIDTAGLRRKSKIKKTESLDFFSTVRTYRSIQRCDVAMLVIDATLIMEGFSKSSEIVLSKFKLDKQDVRILEDVSNFKKGLLIVVNKWDLIEKDSKTSILVKQKINEHLKSYNFLKLIFISALTKQRIHKVLEEAKTIYNERAKMIKTSDLNDKILEEIKRMPPQAARGREVKINYITQVRHSPPVIAFFVNEPSLLTENYKRYLEKKIREHFGFDGVPLSLVFKKKN
ncbi:MAG: ribosome biogenesis GTPase Der [Ignavibacteriae bacterium]|jgi:GTP-binding protein|nr:ribosome biogenesis GTPase Der [Ignavibacteriota bacterium]